ncbi:MAG: M20/M25/M40 family metallo-hydrolase [Sphingomonadales bacterium]|jgi:acetylornithine deacetylase/succinyl-diaminopimelate desuccinylase-like protein
MFIRVLTIVILFFGHFTISFAGPDKDEAYAWFRAYLQVDTINPPGNEINAVKFLSEIFDQEGIEWHSAESAPGRGNIWARIKGGNEPALMLLHHSDVVPADPKYWSVDPLSADEKDGFVYGRGALDTKGLGISHLATFIALNRAGKPLNRDVVFLASADEEAGGLYGVGWLTEHHPEIFEGVGMILNEGGSTTNLGEKLVLDIEVTQKVPVWLRIKAVDKPGHGSSPHATSSVTRIAKAMNAILDKPFPARIIPVVDTMFKGTSRNIGAEWEEDFANMSDAIKRPGFLRKLQDNFAGFHALTRDTCSLTRMGGSNKINVVPPEAWAEIDCRMLPDRTVAEFIKDFKSRLEGLGVEVEIIMAFSPAISPTDNILFKAIETVMRGKYPGIETVPNVSTGFTDSHFTRDLGIASYGYSTDIIEPSETDSVHGNDERTNINAFKQGVIDLFDIVGHLVYQKMS